MLMIVFRQLFPVIVIVMSTGEVQSHETTYARQVNLDHQNNMTAHCHPVNLIHLHLQNTMHFLKLVLLESRNLQLTHRGGCRSELGSTPLFPGASTRMSEMAKAIVALRHRFRSQMGDELTGAIVALFAKFLPTGNAVEVALRKKNSTYILNDIIIQSILEDNRSHMRAQYLRGIAIYSNVRLSTEL